MAKLWGGRFARKKMDADVLKFTSSIDVDKKLAEYDCVSTKVHVQMLCNAGLLSNGEKKKLLGILDGLLDKIKKGKFEKLENYEDIHSAIQDYVEKKAPLAAKKMHTGRSRNEQVVNDVRLYCKDNIEEIQKLILKLQKTLTHLAKKNINIIMPGYTHLNRAQPVLFSHLVMAYVEMLGRDHERLEGAKSRSDVSVMGSGAIAGSALKLDRKFTARKLGFNNISANSIDAVSDRDFVVEFVSSLCLVAVHLSRICEDLILYSTAEFGFLEIGADFCTGSSLMPQKKNPDVLELVRGKSAQVMGALNSLVILLKGLPHSYNRDLQEDKKPLFESVDFITSALQIMAGLIASITVKKKAAREALEDEFIYATDLAEYLVRKGLSFKDAHEAVGKIVKHCIKKNINISDLSISELKKFSEELDKNVYGLLNPEVSVENKKTPGSTNPKLVKKEIDKWNKKLK
ncbi:MAG: argininosuccinate lyase [Candidatus Omnitrophica bacterium]|nr:argininosuccinate lyase [Candidatus Omnitrophota bacterium]